MQHVKRITAIAVLAGALLMAIAIAWGWGQGYRAFVVQSNSMAPTFHSGDLLITAPPEPAPGDVITFRVRPGPNSPSVVTHRVLSLTDDGIQTKGDANPTADAGLVDPRDAVGELVATVPNAGLAITALGSPRGILALATTMLAASLTWSLIPRPARTKPSEEGALVTHP